MLTLSQLLYTVILLVPGFICIYLSNSLVPVKKKDTFVSTVLSVTLSVVIHGVYTVIVVLIAPIIISSVIHDFAIGTLTRVDMVILLIYLIGLFAVSCLGGLLVAVTRKCEIVRRLSEWIGFHNQSLHDNLWDEIMYIMKHNHAAPLVIIAFKDVMYSGKIVRSSLDVNSYEFKEILLAEPCFRETVSDNWVEYPPKTAIYLSLKDAESVSIVNALAIVP